MKKVLTMLIVLVLLLLGTITTAQSQPAIEITQMPTWGVWYGYLHGRVWEVNPPDYKVAAYIYVEGFWWTKPDWGDPLTTIRADSAWECNVTTGGIDEYATRFAAYIVPNDVNIDSILAWGNWGNHQDTLLPPALSQYPGVIKARQPGTRHLAFSGFDWIVKQCDARLGPGPNYFTDDEQDVFVDGNGQLHLKIIRRDGRWYSSEVIADTSLGYGTYVFYLASRVDTIDQNNVLGLFTWDELTEEYHREVDIEFSRWGQANADSNAQYVIQPWWVSENMHWFTLNLDNLYSTHAFIWTEDSVKFQSIRGDSFPPPSPDSILESWLYTGSYLPVPAEENPRLNYWLFHNSGPVNNQDSELLIKRFQFIPLSETGVEDHPDAGNVPKATQLAQNYPNPFNASTVISYSLPATDHVTLSIYNLLGQRIVTLLDEQQQAGEHQIVWHSPDLPSGVYFYRIVTTKATETKKMMVLR